MRERCAGLLDETTRTCPVEYLRLTSATHASATSSGVPDRESGAVALTYSRMASQSAVHGCR
jgi:hypothetical protein